MFCDPVEEHCFANSLDAKNPGKRILLPLSEYSVTGLFGRGAGEMPRPKYLSYALNKKTDSILKVNRWKRRLLALMLPVGIVSFLLTWYFAIHVESLLDAWISLTAYDAEAAQMVSRLDWMLFQSLLFNSLFFVFIYGLWSKYNDKFKKRKVEILEILRVEPCEHRGHCTCKDDYCLWIEEEEHVDLI